MFLSFAGQEWGRSLEHYKGLPLIEQAQYPEDYASDLESKIKLDSNYRTHRVEGAGNDNEPMSLFKMLFDQTLKQPKALSQEKRHQPTKDMDKHNFPEFS